MVPVRFTKHQVRVLDEALAGMGIEDRSAGVRALALAALTGDRDLRPRREGKREGGEPRVTSAVPQTVFMPLPPGMEPEMAE